MTQRAEGRVGEGTGGGICDMTSSDVISED